MIAVIFEVWPKPDKKQNYLDIAAALRPILERIDGFISIERFESLTEPGKILSLSFFRDEAAVAAWRKTEDHRRAQAPGGARYLPITGFALLPLSETMACKSANRRRPIVRRCTAKSW
jgi:heme-degrading monooxygenase HmoA